MKRYKCPLALCLIVIFSMLFICILKSYSVIKIKPTDIYGKIIIQTNFLLPMRHHSLKSMIIISPEYPGTPVAYDLKWQSPTTMILEIEQRGMPQGQELTINIDGAPTVIPFIKKSVSRKIRPQIPLKLLATDNLKNIPSRGPVLIQFNTLVNPNSLKDSIVLPAPGNLVPVTLESNGKSYTDYSRWEYTPESRFENETSYRIAIKPGLCSIAGYELRERQEFSFSTVPQPSVKETKPHDGEKNVILYRTLEFTLDQKLNSASVSVTNLETNKGVSGTTELKDKAVIFRPSYAFLPNNEYKVVLNGQSNMNESLGTYELSFSTAKMGRKIWVDVKLGEKHTVTVYKGRDRVRHMKSSGGRPDSPTPTGCFYTGDRGYSFWSPRFGEGATYWVRLVGQILIHSVPKDSRWVTKKDEHDKLGLPASHGCIRLDEEDAKWFYDNVPRGTPVFVHP
ncbi:MAG: hypothetical protein FH756_04235 [Firmicutes bacterium]|nr:hypothetical protein [Bacillota bacterium]